MTYIIMRRIAALKICTTSAFVLNIAVRNTANMDQLMKFALCLLCVVIATNLGRGGGIAFV